MSASGIDPQLTENVAAFRERTVDMARRFGVLPPQIIVARTPGMCVPVGYGESVALAVDPVLLTAPAPIQDRVLAHEFGHITLGHHGCDLRPSRTAIVAGATGLATTIVLVLWFLVTDRMAMLIAGCGIIAVTFTLLALAHAPSRRAEFAADRVAAERFGLPFDGKLSGWLKAHGAPDPGLLWDLVTTHPSHRRRVWAARRHTTRARNARSA